MSDFTEGEKVGIEQKLDAAKIGSLVYVIGHNNHTFVVIPVNETGIHSGRRRFCVVCSRCMVLCHEATTGPIHRMNQHQEKP